MRRCLVLGRAALQAGETPVGSLIERDGTILGEGQESTRSLLDPSAHAEVQAVRAACRNLGSTDLSGSTLYTTVEPCVLCAYAIRRAGVSRVVYGIPAGQAGGVTSSYAILTDSTLTGWPAAPDVIEGVLAEECRALLQEHSRSSI